MIIAVVLRPSLLAENDLELVWDFHSSSVLTPKFQTLILGRSVGISSKWCTHHCGDKSLGICVG